MDSQQIRDKFTSFFEERDHVLRPSASLIPVDPTLLLNNAGMVPFKPYFLGEEEAPWDRAVSIQKCVRTVDIDIIGTTARHLSFFEMMGNFSFGDYFKEKAIPYAYEFVTEDLGLDPDRLWYTVYEDDDEAAQIWIDGVGVPAERVQRGGKDNFWQMGVPGPCGPSSELFWDKGEEYGEGGGPIGGDEDRFVEIWNLVFMQNIQDEPYHVVGDLPAKNIDTGMGLDRVAAVLQGVPTVFDIDTIKAVRDRAASYTGLTYGDAPGSDVSLRLLADHGRTVTFLISDGVVPSNEGRGYVLRRVLRRAVRHAWQYGGEGLIFPGLVDATVELMGAAYPELVTKKDFVLDVVTREEERFRRTLESGHQLLESELEGDAGSLPGTTVFKLHDTYGFPVDLTREIAEERGISVDLEGFESEMAQQRERARAAWKGGDAAAAADIYREILDATGPTNFVGYTHESSKGTILSMVSDGELIDRAEKGQTVELFLDVTPFYGESGGQVGDTGLVETETGRAEIVDTQHALQGLHGHRAKVIAGYMATGQEATASIDSPRREAIRKSHTGTHVLHWAIRDVVGDHAGQAGSLVEPGRLRFDFSHHTQVPGQELAEIESEVNERLIANSAVETTVTSKDEAKEMGAIAFFGDKYGEVVRVVSIGDFSVEFCGGTHTDTSGQVGPLILTSESSIGANVRRVEALTGMAAFDKLVEMRADLDQVARSLKVPAREAPARVEAILEKSAELERQLDAVRSSSRSQLATELASAAARVGEYKLVVAPAEMGGNELRQLALSVRDAAGPGTVTILGSDVGGKGALVGVVTPDLVEAGVSAAELISDGAKALGGGGSRDPELAQAGGPDGSNLEAALATSREAAERALSGL
ncbi:MAG: alanine--tRNA ligase [Actinobacteria bacterium]|nr:MAG: alanine--tRNA ligase [Actinomycetota bacterium]